MRDTIPADDAVKTEKNAENLVKELERINFIKDGMGKLLKEYPNLAKDFDEIISQSKGNDGEIKISPESLAEADKIMHTRQQVREIVARYPNEANTFDSIIAQDNPVADYVRYSTCHCVGLPINVSFANLEKFVEMNASRKPCNVRFYIESGFSETNLEKIKNLFLNSFDDVYFTEIRGLTAKDMDDIESFVYTYFSEQQVHNLTSEDSTEQHQAALEKARETEIEVKKRVVSEESQVFGANVRLVRLENKWKLKELADRVNMSVKYMSEVERGEIQTDNAMKYKIAFALGKTVVELLK